MKNSASAKKDYAGKVVRRLDAVIHEHRQLFASWRSEKWPDYEPKVAATKAVSTAKKK